MIEKILEKAKNASKDLKALKTKEKNAFLKTLIELLLDKKNINLILKENKKDLLKAKSLNKSLQDRLLLNEKRLVDIAKSVKNVMHLQDPTNRILDGFINDDGLNIQKITVPIGLIAVIYEARPNVSIDTAILCFKSSNVCILKGGKEAINTNKALVKILKKALKLNNLNENIVTLLDFDKKEIKKLIKRKDYIDLLIPRGGEALISFLEKNSTIPILKNGGGLCHTYINKYADIKQALDIAVNAKISRPSVCNSLETLLVDYEIAEDFLPKLKKIYEENNVEIRACKLSSSILKDVKTLTNDDLNTEYLDLIINIKIVNDIHEAINHINRHSTAHSDCIVTKDIQMANRFAKEIDSACVYINASTRFTDGSVFGFGSEIGISTNNLHARGPIGLENLLSYKYIIIADGQIRI